MGLLPLLSHPANGSVNGGIPKALCSLKYITVDSATKYIKQIGQGTLLAKIDIKSVFRLLPVHPTDLRWDKHLFIYKCLSFSLRSAPKLFNIFCHGYFNNSNLHHSFITWMIF